MRHDRPHNVSELPEDICGQGSSIKSEGPGIEAAGTELLTFNGRLVGYALKRIRADEINSITNGPYPDGSAAINRGGNFAAAPFPRMCVRKPVPFYPGTGLFHDGYKKVRRDGVRLGRPGVGPKR